MTPSAFRLLAEAALAAWGLVLLVRWALRARRLRGDWTAEELAARRRAGPSNTSVHGAE